MTSLWVVDTCSSNYTWKAYGETKEQAEKYFIAMWVNWCEATGADLDYWGEKFAEVCAKEVKSGEGYMDGEVYIPSQK